MKLYLVYMTIKNDPPVVESIFINRQNMEDYLERLVEDEMSSWEEKNITYFTEEVDTKD